MASTRHNDEGKGVAGTAGGGTAGALAGAGIGAAIGGPVGAAVGAGVGAVAGSATGAAVDYEAHEPGFRAEYESSAAAKSRTWDEVSPAYRFGHSLAADERYRSGEWSAVEPEARQHWESRNEGTWAEFKDAVHHAWDKARGKA